MNNLLIYIDPKKKFNKENESYIKIQIKNSLKYWNKKEIILATNFPYEYKGIKALVVPDELYSKLNRCVIKINVIVYLLEEGKLKEMTWFHDTEAWQVAPLSLWTNKDLCFTDYGWSKKWNGGSMFFQPHTLDIFKLWKKTIERYKCDDERAMMRLTDNNVNDINSRIQRLNITYNIGKRKVDKNIARAKKPLKVLHFHPYRENLLEKFESLLPNNLKKLMYDEHIDNGS